MDTDIRVLISQCEQELYDRDYRFYHHRHISTAWEELVQWMVEKGCEVFDQALGLQYCNETFGSHVLSGINKSDRVRLRAIRMLISYQKDGDFEFRTPTVSRAFAEGTGQSMEGYLVYLRETLCMSEATLSNKRYYLLLFNKFLEDRDILLNDLDLGVLTDFFSCQNFTLAKKHNCNSTLKLFLQYAYDNSLTSKDHSIYILPDNYRKHCKLPTTYEEDEIRCMLNAVDRGSRIGKRDYLILLLAAEYGWRSSDIVNFSFSQMIGIRTQSHSVSIRPVLWSIIRFFHPLETLSLTI